jgi:type I pantothenate kinase
VAPPFVDFDRASWAQLRASTPLTLGEGDLAELQGINERVPLDEVETIYLPLSRLLTLHVAATQNLRTTIDTFLGTPASRIPYVIGVAGSVAVGKSTFARILQALLRRWPAHPRVDLVATDGFLLPLATLESGGILNRKGFPESYDVRRLVEFITDVKAGAGLVRAPVYSHQTYDIVPGEYQVVDRPDILIIEGLNVLQRSASSACGPREDSESGLRQGYGQARRSEAEAAASAGARASGGGAPRALKEDDAVSRQPSPVASEPVFVSDFFDFSIYIDADEQDIERWYIARFLTLRETVFRDPQSYFHRYSRLTDTEAIATAREIWRTINGVNLRENIQPTRDRARLILEKDRDHLVQRVRLRRV